MNRISNYHDIASSEKLDLKHLARAGMVITPEEKIRQQLFIIQNLLPKFTKYLKENEVSPDDYVEILEVCYKSIFLFNLQFYDLGLRNFINADDIASKNLLNLAQLALNKLNYLLNILQSPLTDLRLQYAMVFLNEILAERNSALYPDELRLLAYNIKLKMSSTRVESLESFMDNLMNEGKIRNNIVLLIMETYCNNSILDIIRESASEWERIDYKYNVISLCKLLLEKRENNHYDIGEMYDITSRMIVDIINYLGRNQSTIEGDEFIREKILEAINFTEIALGIPFGLLGRQKLNARIQLSQLHLLLGNRESAYRVLYGDYEFISEFNMAFLPSPDSTNIKTLISYVDLGIEFAAKGSPELISAEYQLRNLEIWLKAGLFKTQNHAQTISKLREDINNKIK